MDVMQCCGHKLNSSLKLSYRSESLLALMLNLSAYLLKIIIL